MGRRPRKSNFEHTVEALALLPWKLSLALIPIAYFGFHWLSQVQPPPPQGVEQLGSTLTVSMLKTAGMFLQYLAPLMLALAALTSYLGKRRRTKLLEETETRTSSAPLQKLTWREFEQLVGAYFERLGYSVSFTPDGADGGVDVIARKGREIFLIQCKQWRATQVGVSVVRELFGVMAAQGATGAFVVSIGPFSADAKAFAEGRNIELVNANELLKARRPAARMAEPSPASSASPAATPPTPQRPSCPKCGAPMVQRIAKQGPNAGETFYGCSTYPKCRGLRPA
jgi:restriction system protein